VQYKVHQLYEGAIPTDKYSRTLVLKFRKSSFISAQKFGYGENLGKTKKIQAKKFQHF